MSTITIEKLGTCETCQRQVMDNGRCLYCTTSEALELRRIVPDQALETPDEHQQVFLVDLTSGQCFQLDSPRTRIGRDPRNQITIDDDIYVSRFHAFITFEDNRYWLEDVGSKNGTKLNGSFILDRELLSHGDVVSIGRCDFEVLAAASAPRETPSEDDTWTGVRLVQFDAAARSIELN